MMNDDSSLKLCKCQARQACGYCLHGLACLAGRLKCRAGGWGLVPDNALQEG